MCLTNKWNVYVACTYIQISLSLTQLKRLETKISCICVLLCLSFSLIIFGVREKELTTFKKNKPNTYGVASWDHEMFNGSPESFVSKKERQLAQAKTALLSFMKNEDFIHDEILLSWGIVWRCWCKCWNYALDYICELL